MPAAPVLCSASGPRLADGADPCGELVSGLRSVCGRSPPEDANGKLKIMLLISNIPYGEAGIQAEVEAPATTRARPRRLAHSSQ